MPITHTISQQYSGGGSSGVGGSKSYTGNAELNFDVDIGAGTTTLTPSINLDPDNNIQSYCFLASGNCSLQFAGVVTVTLTLPAGSPIIAGEVNDVITGVPTAAGTYALRLINPSSSTVTVNGRMLIE
jgi:hypothetical protein